MQTAAPTLKLLKECKLLPQDAAMHVDYSCCEWLSASFFAENPLNRLLIRNRPEEYIMRKYLED